MEEKSRWADELHELIPKPCRDRPFVCDGLPELCDVVVIGENPAQTLKDDWWRFWDDRNGFNLGKFEEAYKVARLANSLRPISRTRLRLKRLRSNGLKCLDTNVCRNEQSVGAGVGVSNLALFATFIDCHHFPDLKAVIVHGDVAREHWRRIELELPTGVQSYFLRHLSRLGYENIDEVSRKIQNASRSNS